MLPERTCENCDCYRCYAVGDYGSGPYEIYCTKVDDKEDDEDFPHTPAPDCYEPNFWLSAFANDVDGTEEGLDNAFKRFRAYVEQGVPLT